MKIFANKTLSHVHGAQGAGTIPPCFDEQDLQHELGSSVWHLSRILVLSRDPGAWSSTIPVRPFRLCLEDARDLLRVLEECGDSARSLWELLTTSVATAISFLSAHFHQRVRIASGITRTRVRSPELRQLRLLLDRLEMHGPGSMEDRLVYGRYITRVATRLLHEPSAEHAMALRLFADVGDRLGLDSVWKEAIRSFRRVEAKCQLRNWYDGPEDAALRFQYYYRCRRRFVQGDRAVSEYRIRANGVLASIKGKSNYGRNLAKAARYYRKCIDDCIALAHLSAVDFPKHVLDEARYKLWIVHVTAQQWSAAREAWEALHVHSTEFCNLELPLRRDFPTYAAEFVSAPERIGDADRERITCLLERASELADKRQRAWESGLEENDQLNYARRVVSKTR